MTQAFAPYISADGHSLVVTMADGRTVHVPFNSIFDYDATTIRYNRQGRPFTLHFSPKRSNGRIAKQIIDHAKLSVYQKRAATPPTETVEPKAKQHEVKSAQELVADLAKNAERAFDMVYIISYILTEKAQSILIEILSKDSYFLELWEEVQKQNCQRKELYSLFDKVNGKLVTFNQSQTQVDKALQAATEPKAKKPKQHGIQTASADVEAIVSKLEGVLTDTIKVVSKPFELDGESWFYIDYFADSSKDTTSRTFAKREGKGDAFYRFLTEILDLVSKTEPSDMLSKATPDPSCFNV